MARRVSVQVVDDLSGEVATETVTFAVDGVTYDIDLTAAHAHQLRETVEEWARHARRVGGRRTRHPATSTAPSGSRERRAELDAIRAWGREAGYQISDRGRIAEPIVAAYRATQQSAA